MDLKYINEIAPEHCRTSCSDAHPINGRYSAEDMGGCYRCTLMDAGAVPKGWKLVPEKPTEEMLREIQLVESFTHPALLARYKAMLARAPEYKPEPENADD